MAAAAQHRWQVSLEELLGATKGCQARRYMKAEVESDIDIRNEARHTFIDSAELHRRAIKQTAKQTRITDMMIIDVSGQLAGQFVAVATVKVPEAVPDRLLPFIA